MALDNRLDFISDIDPVVINQMTEMRYKFIDIDNDLKDVANDIRDSAGLRAVSLARTYLEIAMQFTIKSLCILGEIHER